MSANVVNESFDLTPVLDERRRLIEELTAIQRPYTQPPQPLTVYSLLFGRIAHPYVVRRVHAVFRRVARTRARLDLAPGYLYAFSDSRSANVVKIGMSSNVKRRLDEWRAALGDVDGRYIRLLFKVRCAYVRDTERLVHALLFAEWLPKRVTLATNQRALEMFAIDPGAAGELRLLCRACALYIEWYVDEIRRRQLSFGGSLYYQPIGGAGVGGGSSASFG